MEWALAVVALALIGYGVVSRRVEGTPVTPAIVFVGHRPDGRDAGARARRPSATGESVKRLAEATLTVVLFADASRIDLRALRREYAVPAAAARHRAAADDRAGSARRRGALRRAHASRRRWCSAILLAPTDAALGQAVVTEPRLPSRIRQGLNVESGLNDGICVPLLFIVLAVAEAEAGEVERAARRPARRRGDRLRADRRRGRGRCAADAIDVRRPPGADRADTGCRSSRSRGAALAYGIAARSAAPASSPRSSPAWSSFGALRGDAAAR